MPVFDDKEAKNPALEKAISEAKEQVAAYQRTQKAQQDEIEAEARKARAEKIESEIRKLYEGDPEDQSSRQDSLKALSERFIEPGGKTYDNFKSAHQELAFMFVKLSYFLAAVFRPHERLLDAMGSVENALFLLMGDSKISEVELHEGVLDTIVCDPAGKLTFNPLDSKFFTAGTPQDAIDSVGKANSMMVTAFLVLHGYDRKEDGRYFTQKEDGKEHFLTPEIFKKMKEDPEFGIKAFARTMGVSFTKGPMGPRGEKAPEPEPLTPRRPGLGS